MERIALVTGVFRVIASLQLPPSQALGVWATVVKPEFDDFYKREVDGLARALALATGDIELAHEAVDEGMVRAYQRWRKVGSYDNPAGWVYRVSLNWARNRVRNRKRETLTDEWTEDQSYSQEIDVDLQRALASLPDEARSVVVTRYILGWSTVDTAHALGISEGTVKSRLSRALDRLQVELGER